MALSVKNMLGGGGAFFPTVFATGVSQSDDVRLFKIVDGEPVKEITNKKWTEKGVLPSEYQEVEYIESTGTQYINSNVILTLNSAIEVKGIMSANDTTLYGVAENTSYGTSINRESAIAIRPRWFNGSSATISTTPDSAHVYKQDKTQFYIDGELKQTASTNLSAFTRPLYLMARNNIGSADWMGGRLYYAKIWDNDVLVFNGIPCYRKSDNVIGMYDTVSNTFFTNNGSGTFGKGADVSHGGYSFKLNELGMYRLSANNGSMTNTYDVLVDYPLEYVIAVKYSVDIPMTTMALSTPSPTTNTAGISRTFTLDTLIKGYKTDGGYLANGVNSYTINSDDSIYVKSSTSAGGYGIGVVKKLDVGQYKFSFDASWSGAYSSFSILGYAESGAFHEYITDRSALVNGHNEFTFDVLASYPIIVIVYSSAYNGNCTFSNIVLETI